MQIEFQPLYEDQYYYIYNRGNNSDTLFYNSDNYNYFIELFQTMLHPFITCYAYSLLTEQFHCVIRINNFNDIPEEYRVLRKGKKLLFIPHVIISEIFRRFFIAYSKSIAIQEKRTGSLFEKNFRRFHITTSAQVPNYIVMINNISAGTTFSSFHHVLTGEHALVKREEMLEWFGSIDNFINAHESSHATTI
jgi:putative transposase